LAVTLRERVGLPTKRPVYTLDATGRIRVEAFELHPVEDCNLRCANCCNMSPFVARRRMTVDELRTQLTAMAPVLIADVFKIMGGEPLLHPEIAKLIRAARESGVGRIVRVFTNGLLLKGMHDDFWSALDQLTISNYASAPVPERTLDLVRAKAVQFGFIVNIKPVTSFNEVLSVRYDADDTVVQKTYDTCWLRHRCIIVRNEHFYKCTRAAYAQDFHERVNREAPPPGFHADDDGIPLPASADQLRDYMNATTPLASCHYCFAGNGPMRQHHQLTRAQVQAGVLSDR
jgi:organic radical activating enzyme